jgi:hypothetical protein
VIFFLFARAFKRDNLTKMLDTFLVSFESLEVSTPFLFDPFFKISSFLHQIFEYMTFSHNTVNELCYVAGFVNSIVT